MSTTAPPDVKVEYTNGATNGTPAALKDSPWAVRAFVYIFERFGFGLIVSAGLAGAWWKSSEAHREDAREERAAFAVAMERQTDRLEAALALVLAEEKGQSVLLAKIQAAAEACQAAPKPRGAR